MKARILVLIAASMFSCTEPIPKPEPYVIDCLTRRGWVKFKTLKRPYVKGYMFRFKPVGEDEWFTSGMCNFRFKSLWW